MGEDKTRFAFADAMRGIAVILVITAHNYLAFREDHLRYHPNLSAILYQCVYGVQLFYLMSAFTLFHSLSGERNPGTPGIRDFFIRRFFRIAPLFYLAITVYVILSREGQISPLNLLSAFTFTNAFSVDWINGIFHGSWSVAVEMIFYLVVPFLFVRVTDLNKAVMLFIGTVLFAFVSNAVMRSLPVSEHPKFNEYLYFYPPAQLPVFSLGIVLFFLVRKKELTLSHRTILALSMLLITHVVLGGKGIIAPFVLLSVGFMLFAFAASEMRPVLVVNPIFIFIGKISFGLYLWHWLAIYMISDFGFAYSTSSVFFNFVLREIFILFVTVIIAYITWKVIETPFIRMAKRITSRNKGSYGG